MIPYRSNKVLRAGYICALGMLHAACSNNTDNNTATFEENKMAVPLPQAITTHAIDQNLLRVDVLVTPSGGTTRTYRLNITNVNNSEVRGTIAASFEPGEYTVSLVYYYEDPDFNDPTRSDGLVELMDLGDEQVSISSGNKSTVDFTDTPPNFTDTDDDGINNLEEVDTGNRTDPFDSLIFPGHTLAPPHYPKLVVYQNESRFETHWQVRAGIEAYNVDMDPVQGAPIAEKDMIHPNATQGFGHSIGLTQPFYYTTITSWQNNNESLESAELYLEIKNDEIANSPAWVSAEARESAVALEWAAVSGAQSYTVYWSDSPSFTTKSVVPNGDATTNTSIIHSNNLQNQSMYYYVVTATVGGVESADSATVGATPYGRLAPLNIIVQEADQQITLQWTEPDGTARVDAYMANFSNVDKNNFQNQYPNTESPLQVTGLQNNTTYHFQFVLIDKYGRETKRLISATPHAQ